MEQKFLSASTLESQSVLQPARSTERLERPAGVVSESRSRLPPLRGYQTSAWLPLRVIPSLRQVRESGVVLTKYWNGGQLARLDSPMLPA